MSLLVASVLDQARRRPRQLAVSGGGSQLTYAELDERANTVAACLRRMGIGRGDRVALVLEKSCAAVAVMQGVLRLGAVYVPIDPLAPPARVAAILADCAVSAVVSQAALAGPPGADPPWLPRSPRPLLLLLEELPHAAERVEPVPVEAGAPAYILYTSGSTGRPKGICLSHRNAEAFVEWAVAALAARAEDRFANHAPFHFDLSVLDLYAAFRAGASVHLVPEALSYQPRALTRFLAEERITIWYSVPSALLLMMSEGDLLEQDGLALRVVCFAGEPFPIKPLRRLFDRLHPTVRLFNLYGPTETNVCTAHEVTAIPPHWRTPVPIGRACSGDRVWARKSDGSEAAPGEEGELLVAGPTVMLGYWGGPPQGDAPYATGDRVRRLDADRYLYLGRLDDMVKVRGFRVEPAEVESVLAGHPDVVDAAVAALGGGAAARLWAFVVPDGRTPTLLELKRHCALRLPRHMIVDRLRIVAALPRNRNGKIDRQRLKELL
jgi:amino acid adenylation domain-containing protein